MKRYSIPNATQDNSGQWVRYGDYQAAINDIRGLLPASCSDYSLPLLTHVKRLVERAEKAEAELTKRCVCEADIVQKLTADLEAAEAIISELNRKLAEQAKKLAAANADKDTQFNRLQAEVDKALRLENELAAAKREESGSWRKRLVIPFRTHLAAVQAEIPEGHSLRIESAAVQQSFVVDSVRRCNFEAVLKWLAPEDQEQADPDSTDTAAKMLAEWRAPKASPEWDIFTHNLNAGIYSDRPELALRAISAVLTEMRRELGL